MWWHVRNHRRTTEESPEFEFTTRERAETIGTLTIPHQHRYCTLLADGALKPPGGACKGRFVLLARFGLVDIALDRLAPGGPMGGPESSPFFRAIAQSERELNTCPPISCPVHVRTRVWA